MFLRYDRNKAFVVCPIWTGPSISVNPFNPTQTVFTRAETKGLVQTGPSHRVYSLNQNPFSKLNVKLKGFVNEGTKLTLTTATDRVNEGTKLTLTTATDRVTKLTLTTDCINEVTKLTLTTVTDRVNECTKVDETGSKLDESTFTC